MNNYTAPEMEVVVFDSSDILTSSELPFVPA